MELIATLRRHPRRTAVVAIVLLALGVVGSYWFAPWNLFIDRTVDEALPGASAPAGGSGNGSGSQAEEAPQAGAEAGDGEIVTLSRGGFISLEHETSGQAVLVELQDGTRFLRLEDLETLNGPDLRVIITDQPLSEDWGVWDDGAFVDLGGLKGNLGSSNYEIPAAVDLGDFETAVIWCRRFSVGFGVAPLEPVS